ncbi:hypothetical protein [Tumidithrix helvetica]
MTSSTKQRLSVAAELNRYAKQLRPLILSVSSRDYASKNGSLRF